jgi:ERF superfamily protein
MNHKGNTMNEVIEGTIDDQPPKPSQALAVTPAQMLAVAVNQGADLAKLEKLMELQERWEANEARKAYNAAVAEFKKNPPDIIKDKENKQYGSKYATLANLVNNGSAALAPFGLTVEWKIDQSSQIKVTCILKHALGHSEQVSITGAPDDSGAKNKLQQIKSTITYLKGETFQCVTGITARDCPGDNDGNGAGKPKQDVQNAAERREAEHRAKHDEAVAKYSESIDYIKDRIKNDDAAAAASEWRQFTQTEMEALWLAPSKGGIFTTREREYLKTKLPAKEQTQ